MGPFRTQKWVREALSVLKIQLFPPKYTLINDRSLRVEMPSTNLFVSFRKSRTWKSRKWSNCQLYYIFYTNFYRQSCVSHCAKTMQGAHAALATKTSIGTLLSITIATSFPATSIYKPKTSFRRRHAGEIPVSARERHAITSSLLCVKYNELTKSTSCD